MITRFSNLPIGNAKRYRNFNNTQTFSPTPTIATSSTIAYNANNPSIVVTTSTPNYSFRTDILLTDFTVGVGTTGLSASSLTRNSATQVTIAFTGTAVSGSVTITALTSAAEPVSQNNSNTLTIESVGAGYAAGGIHTSRVSTVDKFIFSNDSRSTLGTGLSGARDANAGFSSSTAGYVAGGFAPSVSPGNLSTVDKFLFSDDSRSTLGTGLSSIRYGPTGFSSSTAGYVAGGKGGAHPTNINLSTVDKFLFSNDSRSTLGTGLSITRVFSTGFSSSTAGYVVSGGGPSGDVTTIEKFNFSNDSRSILSSGLGIATSGLAGFASSTDGYAAGGCCDLSIIDKILFSNDSVSRSGATLSVARRSLSGFNTK